MNLKKLSAAAIATLVLATGSSSFAQTNIETFTFTNGFTIPDANLGGLADARMISVLQPTWSIVDINVSLNLSGGFNGDLYAFLTHDSGFSILLNRSGRTGGNPFGYSDAGFNITLDDSALTDIHLYGGNGGLSLSGIFQPDGRNVHPLTALDSSLRSAFLDSFNFGNPNGMWTLFVADLASGQTSVLDTWSLQITTTAIPEPSSVALGGLSLIFILKALRRSRQQG